MSGIKLILSPEQKQMIAQDLELCRSDFLGKKLRFDWSQTRAGTAIFASGRMEGPTFDNERRAREWLLESLSIVVGKDGRGARAWTTQDIAREEAVLRKLVG